MIVLDAGALIAVERGNRDVASVIEAARRQRITIVVPAGVVGQAWRGGGRQARLARLLATPEVEVEPLTDASARAAGELCGSAGTSDVIDATVVLAARRYGAPVLSADRVDLEQLDGEIVVIDC